MARRGRGGGRRSIAPLFQGGRFEKNLSANEEVAVPNVRAAKRRIGAQRLQMVRHQVVGTLQSFVSNRQNDVRQVVERSSLDATTKHQLHFINKRQAWFDRDDVVMPAGETTVPHDVRKLAQCIMRLKPLTNARADMIPLKSAGSATDRRPTSRSPWGLA